MYRVNIGCGQTPVEDWKNFDNSPSIRLAALPPIAIKLLRLLGLLSREQNDYIFFVREHRIGWADAVTRIPLPNNSVEALYSSHMLEHLDRIEAEKFLVEAKRVLKPNGIIRIAVPDLHRMVTNYNETGDADELMERTRLSRVTPRTFAAKLRLLIAGDRKHKWMYDGESLSRLLVKHGFQSPKILNAGETFIADPGALNLKEREAESVYVEAFKI